MHLAVWQTAQQTADVLADPVKHNCGRLILRDNGTD